MTPFPMLSGFMSPFIRPAYVRYPTSINPVLIFSCSQNMKDTRPHNSGPSNSHRQERTTRDMTSRIRRTYARPGADTHTLSQQIHTPLHCGLTKRCLQLGQFFGPSRRSTESCRGLAICDNRMQDHSVGKLGPNVINYN